MYGAKAVEGTRAFRRSTWPRLVESVRVLAHSEVGTRAKLLFGALIVLYLGINGLNVVNSYVGRDFMTAIANHDRRGFAYFAMVYVVVFAFQTVVAVIERFAEDRLGLLWREWLTRRVLLLYLHDQTYYRMQAHGVLANPDERISDDIRSFTTTALSFTLMIFNGSLTVLSFAGVLWSIDRRLFFVCIAYAGIGSVLAIFLGRPLVRLNYTQFDKEANFRTDLIHVRENAESIAVLHRESWIRGRLLHHLDELVANFRHIIGVNRNLGFFTNGYNYMIQIIPALLVAPLYISGEVEFGVITQAAMAFSTLVGAFSLIVNQFQSISSFAAVMARLGALADAIEHVSSGTRPGVKIKYSDSRLAYEKLTLRSPSDNSVLVKELTLDLEPRSRVLVSGSNNLARAALFRATAGTWEAGEGRVIRPRAGRVFFLPERPYLPPGTLRELVVRKGDEQAISDAYVHNTLKSLELDSLVVRAGGLDVERRWNDTLSVTEQQLLIFARLLLAAPPFAVIDCPTSPLTPAQLDRMLKALAERKIAYLILGPAAGTGKNFDSILEIAGDGTWRLTPA